MINFNEFYREIDPWGTTKFAHERARLRLTEKMLGHNQFNHALDLGCGEGIFTKIIKQHAILVDAIDISLSAISRAKQRCAGVDFTVGDIRNFKFFGNYDLIVCLEVIYYLDLEDQKNILQKMRDFIDKNGLILLSFVINDQSYIHYADFIKLLTGMFSLKLILVLSVKSRSNIFIDRIKMW